MGSAATENTSVCPDKSRMVTDEPRIGKEGKQDGRCVITDEPHNGLKSRHRRTGSPSSVTAMSHRMSSYHLKLFFERREAGNGTAAALKNRPRGGAMRTRRAIESISVDSRGSFGYRGSTEAGQRRPRVQVLSGPNRTRLRMHPPGLETGSRDRSIVDPQWVTDAPTGSRNGVV